MATLMTTMMENMEATRLRIEGQEYNGGRYNRGRWRDRGRTRGHTGRGGKGRRRTPQGWHRGGRYCSTHGNCAHGSGDCETPGSDHNNDANFVNMMGGSTANCDWHCRNKDLKNRDYKINIIDNSTTFASPSNLEIYIDDITIHTSNQTHRLSKNTNKNKPTTIIDPSNKNPYNISKDAYIEATCNQNTIQSNIAYIPPTYSPLVKTTSRAETNIISSNKYYAALADTAATHNYLDNEASNFCDNLIPAFGPNIKVENGNIITLNQQSTLELSNKLSKQAQLSYIIDKLATGSLISIGQLCGNDCTAFFSKYNLKIIKNNTVIIECKQNCQGLRDILLENTSTPQHRKIEIRRNWRMALYTNVKQRLNWPNVYRDRVLARPNQN